MATRVLLLLLSTLLLSYALRVEVGGRAEPPRGWSLGATPPANQQINFVVFVKQQNFAALEEKFLSVSNPDSPEYGQFLTLEEAESIIAPKEEHMEAVEGWLTSFSEADVQRLSDRFEVRSTVAVAEQILGEAQFYTHTNDVTGRSLVRANGKITIPEEVSEAVDFVAGVTELGDRETIGKITARREISPRATVTVTPELLRKFYNIPEKYQVAKSKKTFNGIAAFNDDFQQPGFDAFKTKYNLPKFDTVRMAGNGSVADYVESDLDVQYISAMSQGTDLLFLQEPNTFWILQFLMDASKLERVPTVFSISYGWFETDQCLWATVNCPKLGYSGPQYVNRTNTAFQVFGATGVSIFIASGDDGSPSPYCPIDPYVKGMYGPTACAAITISNATANMSCSLPYITGRGTNDACDQVYEATQNTYPNLQQAATQALAKANPDCGIPTGSSYGVLQSKCICSDLQSVNLGGWDVSGYEVDPATIGHIFAPIWPGSSPYVTSVGATYFVSKDGVNVDSEVPSDVIQGANFEGGGGFSYFQKGLEYQQQAVKSWLTKAGRKAPPAWSFSPESRGYPDISFNGNNYDVYFDQFNHSPVSGTSASSPATAGLFNLINDVLFQNGKTQLGFLNPLLYKMAREYPKAFNDLTHGDNRCDGGLCCLYGFVATEGWDPVSGLGTPNFEEILKYVSKVKRFQL